MYSRYEKAKILKQMEIEGVDKTSEKTGITKQDLYLWKSKAIQFSNILNDEGDTMSRYEMAIRIRDLEKDLKKVESDYTILNTFMEKYNFFEIISKSERYRFIQSQSDKYKVNQLCSVLHVTAPSYYNFINTKE